MRRYGANAVSDCEEKAWWKQSKDTDVRRYVCHVRSGEERWNQVHDDA